MVTAVISFLLNQDVFRANADGRGSPAIAAAPFPAPPDEVAQDQVDQRRQVPVFPPARTKYEACTQL